MADITDAAVAIADGEGLDAVTMRSLASAVGTSAAALYRYVDSRDELVGHMVDRATAEVRHPSLTGDWVRDLTSVTYALRDTFRGHPWLAAAVSTPVVAGPHVLDHLDWCLAALEPVEAPASAKLEAIALLTGVAALFSAAATTPDPLAFSRLEPSRHPRLAAIAAQGPPASAGDDLVERVVAGILRGILGTEGPPPA